MNYAGNIEIIRKRTFMTTKKICVKVIFIQGAFKDFSRIFHNFSIFKACANQGLTGSYTEDEPNLVRKKTSRRQHHLQWAKQ